MSDSQVRRRIRAQSTPSDANALGFVLDAPLQEGAAQGHAPLDPDAPLARALFAIDGVDQVHVAGAVIWVRKQVEAEWALLKPIIAEAIRTVLDQTDAPLGKKAIVDDPDVSMLNAVETLLEQQVNPSVAAHGGHIAVDRVENATVYLRMSGGCQGCAASSATLRQGVERMLRAALPDIRDIVDVTDHAAGANPFYASDGGQSPVLNRAIPPDVIGWNDDQITVAPEYLASRLGLTPEALRDGMRNGDVVGVTETGVGEHRGNIRVVVRSATRAWAAEVMADGSAREIPPPKLIKAASQEEQDLADRVRQYLEDIASPSETVTYGALARALGLWTPGSVRKVTRALEATMRHDARDGQPFIAARTVSRAGGGLPARGFFDLARALDRGPAEGETEEEFHAREIARVNRQLSQRE